MRAAPGQGEDEGGQGLQHSRTEQEQQGEAKQLEQAPAGTPGCIPEPFQQQEMNNSELWEGLYQPLLVLCSVKCFK